VKLERDVKTPRKEIMSQKPFLSLNDVVKIIKLNNSYRSNYLFKIICVTKSKNNTYLLLLRTLNSPLKEATLPFSK